MSLQNKLTSVVNLGIVILLGVAFIFSPLIFDNQPKVNPIIFEINPKNTDISTPKNCQSWKKVNTNGFGLPSEFNVDGEPIFPITEKPFQGEEGFEVLVYKDQLYLGMEADNELGARLWRTRKGVSAPNSQLDWEEVSEINGKPFGVNDLNQADHVDSLVEFKDWIFVSTANRTTNPKGTLVFRSPNGNSGSWEDTLRVIGPGFGKPQNENFKDMQIFNDHLCGGTWNEKDGAEVWCTSDGVNWQQKNISGFGESSNTVIWSGHVFDDYLFFGLQNSGDPEINSDDYGRLFRTPTLADPAAWQEVFQTPKGVPWGNILGDLNGFLYISVPSDDGILIYRSSSGDPESWEIISLPGLNNDKNNKYVFADGATIYNDALYLGVVSGRSMFTIWRTGSTSFHGLEEAWELVPLTDIIDPYNIHVQLVTFNDALYAWTSNPVSGQQVWRYICNENESSQLSSSNSSGNPNL